MTTYNRYTSGSSSRAARPTPAPNGRRRRKRTRGQIVLRWLKIGLAIGGLLFVATASAVAGTIFAFSRNLPSLDELAKKTLAQTTTIYDRNGNVIAELHGAQNRYIVKSNQIPDLMKYATVAKEDERFYQHHGIDFQGLARAMAANIEAGSVVQGGSTITEQYVKNTYLTFDRTMKRKIDEAILSWKLEDQWSKDRILTAYLNTVYYGEGAYGVQAAAQRFFNKDVSRLKLPQIALLAALPKSPNEFSPIAFPDRARSQRNFVLERMAQQGYISPRQMVVAKKAKLGVSQTPPPAYKGPAAYFVADVVKDLSKRYTDAEIFGGGLKVYTTIDMKAQAQGIATVKKFMGQPDDPAVALVSIDPATGYIRTMVGGLDFAKQKINWATQGQRQAGSAMKPFTLTAAIEAGANPDTTYYISHPLHIPMPGANPPVWDVTTYDGSSAGRISLTQATVMSDNTVYAQLILDVGPANVVDVAHRMGIKSPLQPVPSLALGSLSVNPLEMASAYATLAAGGIYREPRTIVKVVLANGKTDWTPSTKGRRAISEGVAYAVNKVLKANVLGGTGSPTRAYFTRPAAGKTGTTENHVDAWFCGYTPNLSTAIWMGYPENYLRPMYGVHGSAAVAGGTFCAPMWGYFMSKAVGYLGLPGIDFPLPDKYAVFKPWKGKYSTMSPSASPSKSPQPGPTVTKTIAPSKTPKPTKTPGPTKTPTPTTSP